jgi:hypothetical protein
MHQAIWSLSVVSLMLVLGCQTGGARTAECRDMENCPPPAPVDDPGAPRPADVAVGASDFRPSTAPKLNDVGKAWTKDCVGKDGDNYENNCAHYLSDAFIRAGFTELRQGNPHINARCAVASAKRPLRARDMWSWFKSKATRTNTKLERNTGWWAVFQLKESAYWGGHVILVDTDNWVYYGTPAQWSWDQYLYQW